jgi:hypothetical protein
MSDHEVEDLYARRALLHTARVQVLTPSTTTTRRWLPAFVNRATPAWFEWLIRTE